MLSMDEPRRVLLWSSGDLRLLGAESHYPRASREARRASQGIVSSKQNQVVSNLNSDFRRFTFCYMYPDPKPNTDNRDNCECER